MEIIGEGKKLMEKGKFQRIKPLKLFSDLDRLCVISLPEVDIPRPGENVESCGAKRERPAKMGIGRLKLAVPCANNGNDDFGMAAGIAKEDGALSCLPRQ